LAKLNKGAQKAGEECLKIIQDEQAVQYLTLIKQQRQQIQDRNWPTYP